MRLPCIAFAAALLAAPCALPQSGAPALENPPRAIERADFVALPSPLPPPDSAPWAPVSLPDNWHHSRPGASGAGWYRIEVHLPAQPRRVHAVYLPRDAASVTRIYVNGTIAGSTQRPEAVLRLNQQPYHTGTPASMFHEGRNVIHIFVEARSELRQGLTRVWFGNSTQTREMWFAKYKLHVFLVLAFAFVAMAAGVVALVVWARPRRDIAMFWFGLAAVLMGAPTVAGFLVQAGPPGAWGLAWQVIQAYAYAPPLALGALAIAGVGTKRFAIVLWLLLAAGCVLPWILGDVAFAQVHVALGLLFLCVLAVSFVAMLARSGSSKPWMRAAVGAALLAAIGLAAHDLAHWLGWLDFDRLALAPFQAPVLTLALGMLLISRHIDAVRELAESKATLEARVVERTAQIEQAHEHLRTLESEQATVQERQRIMADMHDGLGASLVGLLGAVQTGSAGRDELERRAHAALQELRLAVDSLDTPPGDLNMALGTVRHRLRDPIEASGVAFDWRVADLPRLAHFSPSRILHLQRILFEAVNNALRHAGAKRIAVDARADADAVEVSVTDDGRGLNGAKATGGRGLMIMQRRASALGGSLDVWSPGSGTRVTLRFPLAAPSM